MDKEKEDAKKVAFNRRNTVNVGKTGRGDLLEATNAAREISGGKGQTSLESMDLEMASAEEIIANVEKMIK